MNATINSPNAAKSRHLARHAAMWGGGAPPPPVKASKPDQPFAPTWRDGFTKNRIMNTGISVFITGFFHLLQFSIATGQDDWLTIESSSGKSLQICPLSIKDDRLTFLRANDQAEFSIPVTSITSDSLTAVNEWLRLGKHLSYSFKVDASVEHGVDHKTKRTRGEVTIDPKTNEVESVMRGTKSKYRVMWFDPKLVITNENHNKVTPYAHVRLMSLVRSHPGYMVLNMHEVTIPPIKPKCHHSVELEKATVSKFDARGFSLSAPEYAGYLVLVMDIERQKILLTKTDMTSLNLGDHKTLVELKQYSRLSPKNHESKGPPRGSVPANKR